MATTFKIHPAIGIARLGNSNQFFIGPELPGDHSPPQGGYKDGQCRLKKQAARFRVFRFENGVLDGEVTAAEATITWTAHLANTKGAADLFVGPFEPNAGPRNATINDRNSLKIDPGERSITGPNQSASFETGTFMGVTVPLGEMRTEPDGHLLILGGSGNSGSPTNKSIKASEVEPNPFANHNEWYDDISDGFVKASVTLNGSNIPIEAMPAWVICAPPKYAPAIEDMITLYDVLFELTAPPPPATPSFGKDIFPILDRADKSKWLYKFPGSDHSVFSGVIPPPGDAGTRQFIAGLHRDPNEDPKLKNATSADMPKIWSDGFNANNAVKTTAALTNTQYANMQNWAAGTFTSDAPPPPETKVTPAGLDRAALENCVGAAFFPGIETSWKTRDVYEYIPNEPFRLDWTKREPGDLTKQMSAPWQSDFLACYADPGDGESLLWWPAHRPLQVWPEDGSPQAEWTRGLVNSSEELIKNFHRLGVIVQKGNQFLETERQPGCKNCYLIVEKSTFGQDEVEVQLPGTAEFTPAFWVAVEGFSNDELGLSAGNLGNPPVVPVITATIDPLLNPLLDQTQAGLINTMLSVDQLAPPVVPQDLTLLTPFQRFLYPFTISFTGDAGFNALNPDQVAIVTITASISAGNATRTASANLELTKGQNPYFLNVNPANPNQPFWLSFDTRFFKAIGGQSRFGVGMTNNPDDAPGFIANVINNLNNPNANLGGDTFEGLTQDEGASALEFLGKDSNGNETFNFALARVRLIGKTPGAKALKVRVFFRLFQAQTTGSDFNDQTTYRFASDGVPFGHKIARLGVQNDQNGQPEYVTIPFFAAARINLANPAKMDDQQDPLNAPDITVNPNKEVDTYFGCWLDINQPQQKFLPLTPPAGNFDGPWTNIPLFSINEVITKSPHQCMIAEIRFDDTPIPKGATSATSDKIAQRNIAWIDGPNPGDDPSRQMPHPFEIRPSPTNVETPDELMIMWGNTPAGSNAYFYLPLVNAADILHLADSMYSDHRLTAEDPHTIKCPIGGVTFIPIPTGTARSAGLMTIDLVPGIHRGESYDITVRQLSDASLALKQAGQLTGIATPAAVVTPKGFTWRSPLGAFQMTLNISTKEQLLLPEERLLAWLRWILQAIPPQNRWYPVMLRYVDQIAGRVRGLGGDPDTIVASLEGNVDGFGSALCGRLTKWLLPLLIALLLIILTLAPVIWTVPVLVALLILVAVWYWRCKPTFCDFLGALILGISLALLLLGALVLLDYGSAAVVWMLALLAVVDGVLVILSALRCCCRSCK
jgi:hypothetical protein